MGDVSQEFRGREEKERKDGKLGLEIEINK